VKVTWLDQPEEHDYPAAAAYLALLCDPALAQQLTDELRAAAPWEAKAKDIARASRLPLLPADDPHVASDLDKLRKGKALSPVLLVRGDLARGAPLVIADGFHRVCAVHLVEPNTVVPARIVSYLP